MGTSPSSYIQVPPSPPPPPGTEDEAGSWNNLDGRKRWAKKYKLSHGPRNDCSIDIQKYISTAISTAIRFRL